MSRVLCEKSLWSKYNDEKFNSYAIGGTSVEMHFKSFMSWCKHNNKEYSIKFNANYNSEDAHYWSGYSVEDEVGNYSEIVRDDEVWYKFWTGLDDDDRFIVFCSPSCANDDLNWGLRDNRTCSDAGYYSNVSTLYARPICCIPLT